MALTKKHYEMVARQIRDTRAEYHFNLEVTEALGLLTEKLANNFAEDNPRFRRKMFLNACDPNI